MKNGSMREHRTDPSTYRQQPQRFLGAAFFAAGFGLSAAWSRADPDTFRISAGVSFPVRSPFDAIFATFGLVRSFLATVFSRLEVLSCLYMKCINQSGEAKHTVSEGGGAKRHARQE